MSTTKLLADLADLFFYASLVLKVSIQLGQKAIIASGYSETDRVKETLRLGAGTYIRKPYLLETMGKAVRAVLSS